MPYNGSDLTGAFVKERRESHRLSRAKFSELAGLAGKSTARLYNIEVNDQWKPGDRDRVATLLTQLELGALPTDARVIVRPGMTIHPASVDAPAGPAVIPLPEDPEDLLDALSVVLPGNGAASISDFTQASERRLADDLLGDALLTEPDGVYRVSNSELQTFKRCRRKWWLAWYQRLMLQTEDFTSVRATGTRVHRALAYWYVPDGEKRVDPRDALERVIVDDWTKVAKLAQERRTSDEQLGELAVEFAQATNLERAMVEGYVQWLEETGADAELRITASETPLLVNVQVEVDGEWFDVQLIGLLDVRAMRVTDGVALLLDHKTVGDLTAPVVTLPQNEQVLHYMLLEYLNAVEQEVRSWSGEESLGSETYVFRAQSSTSLEMPFLPGVNYHGTWCSGVDSSSPGRGSLEQRPEQPRTVSLGMPQFAPQQGRGAFAQTQNGGAQAQAQRGAEASRSSHPEVVGGIQAEDVRIDEGVLAAATREALGRVGNGALYNMLRRVKRSARAKPPFYDRIEVRHNGYEIDAYRTRAMAVIREIIRARRALDNGGNHLEVAYPSPNPSCRCDCDFFAVCNLLDDGSRGVNDMINALYRTTNPLERYRKQVEK